MTPLIAISLGDPLGIGPQIIVKSLRDDALRRTARWIVFGPREALDHVARVTNDAWWFQACATLPASVVTAGSVPPTHAGAIFCVEVDAIDATGAPIAGLEDAAAVTRWLRHRLAQPRQSTREGGALSMACVQRALDLACLPQTHPWHAHAICTAPISKHAWALAGFTQFPGHTELCAARCGASSYAMMFHAPPVFTAHTHGHVPSPGLNVILATVHQPLKTVSHTLTTQRIVDCIQLGATHMQRLGVARPRVGVAGLNPHAGEDGLLGDEDARIIAPAITQAQAAFKHHPSLQGMTVSGPHPGDTIFQRALAWPDRPPERFDLVVAMYHDQGLIPLKTLAWDRAVNMTVGLPFLRTSPDHGTAFDIAHTASAHPGSMHAALQLAASACAPRAS